MHIASDLILLKQKFDMADCPLNKELITLWLLGPIRIYLSARYYATTIPYIL